MWESPRTHKYPGERNIKVDFIDLLNILLPFLGKTSIKRGNNSIELGLMNCHFVTKKEEKKNTFIGILKYITVIEHHI